VTYPRKFVARSNALRFGSGTALGLVEISVTGFTSAGVEVYDVTNRSLPSG
jgi:hypothetical protein